MSSTYPWLSSYEQGVPATVEIPTMTLHQFLTDAARKYPSKTAVRMVLRYLPLGLAVQAKLTYRELDELSDRFAAALAAQGIKKGARVAIMLPNCPQQAVFYFGVLKAGAVVVNTNPTYPPHELEPLMKASGAEGNCHPLRPLRPRQADSAQHQSEDDHSDRHVGSCDWAFPQDGEQAA
jgi:long-chain acyl-CoA synthetase